MTTASLRYLPAGQIHVALGEVHISPGFGNHRFVLMIRVTGTWLDADSPTSNAVAILAGAVWTDQPSYRWLASLEPQVLTLRGHTAPEELVISLTDDQLVSIERARGQDDLLLRLKLQATLLSPPDGVHPVADEEVPFRVSRSRWQELLDQVGTEVGIVIRVPGPLVDSAWSPPPAAAADDSASLAQAADRLRQARAELRDHQWEQCVATCRRVLENVGLLAQLPTAKSFGGVPAGKRTKEQRWAAIYYAVKSMASAAHHDDATTEDFSWSRADAEAILAATAGLLKHFETG